MGIPSNRFIVCQLQPEFSEQCIWKTVLQFFPKLFCWRKRMDSHFPEIKESSLDQEIRLAAPNGGLGHCAAAQCSSARRA